MLQNYSVRVETAVLKVLPIKSWTNSSTTEHFRHLIFYFWTLIEFSSSAILLLNTDKIKIICDSTTEHWYNFRHLLFYYWTLIKYSLSATEHWKNSTSAILNTDKKISLYAIQQLNTDKTFDIFYSTTEHWENFCHLLFYYWTLMQYSMQHHVILFWRNSKKKKKKKSQSSFLLVGFQCREFIPISNPLWCPASAIP